MAPGLGFGAAARPSVAENGSHSQHSPISSAASVHDPFAGVPRQRPGSSSLEGVIFHRGGSSPLLPTRPMGSAVPPSQDVAPVQARWLGPRRPKDRLPAYWLTPPARRPCAVLQRLQRGDGKRNGPKLDNGCPSRWGTAAMFGRCPRSAWAKWSGTSLPQISAHDSAQSADARKVSTCAALSGRWRP